MNPAENAILLADRLLHESLAHRTRREEALARRLARMVEDPDGKTFTIALADQIFRARSPVRATRRLGALARRLGIPSYLSAFDRASLRVAVAAAGICPWLVMPLIARQLRMESSHVILPGEPHALRSFLDER
ncbi:MAG: 1-pyrroline-5-carboxylate dehydrogenase, partial [Chthoniobacteraceae bacterium]